MSSKTLLVELETPYKKINSTISLNFIFIIVLIPVCSCGMYIFCFFWSNGHFFHHHLLLILDLWPYIYAQLLPTDKLRYLDINFHVFYSFMVSFPSLLLHLPMQTSYCYINLQRLLDQSLDHVKRVSGLSKPLKLSLSE